MMFGIVGWEVWRLDGLERVEALRAASLGEGELGHRAREMMASS